MDERDALIAEIEAAWRPVAAILDHLTDDELLGAAEGSWTRKDVVAHLGWWEASSAATLEAIAAGADPPWRDETTDATNARVEAEWKHAPAHAVRQFGADAHARLVAALRAIDPADLFTPGRCPWLDGDPLSAMVRGDTTEHYPEHLDALGG